MNAEIGPNVIETASGRYYDFLDPDPAVISVSDIAHALGNICRYAGHTKRFYSVAEHSVLVHDLVRFWEPDLEELHAAALFHDAHEAYVWDAPRPIKPLLGEQFASLADTADWAVGQALGIDPALFKHELVKHADNLALLEEARRLLVDGPDHWTAFSDEQKAEPWPLVNQWPVGYDPVIAGRRFAWVAERKGFS